MEPEEGLDEHGQEGGEVVAAADVGGLVGEDGFEVGVVEVGEMASGQRRTGRRTPKTPGSIEAGSFEAGEERMGIGREMWARCSMRRRVSGTRPVRRGVALRMVWRCGEAGRASG
jgi:hypothetical protein